MIPTTKKGQTALEYLLIVVVAIIVVVAVMVWMNAASTGAVTSASRADNDLSCRARTCLTANVATDCAFSATPVANNGCSHFSMGSCVGQQIIGSSEIRGHCEPNATAVYAP